jgi:hypothetical protein
MRGAAYRVQARERPQARVVGTGSEVVEVGRAVGGLEDPALEAPGAGVGADGETDASESPRQV